MRGRLLLLSLLSGCFPGGESLPDSPTPGTGDTPAFDLRVDVLLAEDGTKITRFIDYETRTVCHAWSREDFSCHEATLPQLRARTGEAP